jgi:hypothetical protein
MPNDGADECASVRRVTQVPEQSPPIGPGSSGKRTQLG